MSNRMSGIDRRIVKSKMAIREALISLMQQKDLKDITVKDIVQKADLNRGTFYKHYQYKEDILSEIMDDVIADLIASYREPYKDIDQFNVSELTSSAIKIFDHVSKYANIYSLMIHSNALPGYEDRICQVLKELFLQDFSDYIANAKINKELHASYQAYAILGLIIEWVNGGFKYSPIYMAEQLLEIVKSNRQRV
ncbi:MAG TPA: TetR/AcrR family transcriptional regulator [Bacillus sp. (in: firmicutes)]|uniref:TetR/AcrR family transcriptional regulator n=1 Tax=Bacillus litorisediminis TaxID=2922713 RepID=UPI001FAEDAF5|nr:TetR/AcrR family transcriptional regulator [Bacillus litorisediminis]HWO76583.1 TetR/AcrR family transcriptional regulator [Bacillus sp. (in: firmicutes)]